jgi:hypothetical protein
MVGDGRERGGRMAGRRSKNAVASTVSGGFSAAMFSGWVWHDHAWALIVLQIALATLNIRRPHKNDPETAK